MVSLKQLIEKYRVQPNPALDAFLADIDKATAAIDKGTFTGRSPVRSVEVDKQKQVFTYKFKVLNEELEITGNKTDSLLALLDIRHAALDTTNVDNQELIQDSYKAMHSDGSAAPKKRGRKPKGGEVGNG